MSWYLNFVVYNIIASLLKQIYNNFSIFQNILKQFNKKHQKKVKIVDFSTKTTKKSTAFSVVQKDKHLVGSIN